MTKQSSFKQKIRSRMEKTGERYAAARQTLLQRHEPSQAASPIPAVPGYGFRPGVEPDMAMLTAALAQAGVTEPSTGKPFEAGRLFGLSGGIGFMYFVFEYQGHAPMMTFNCRSWTTPGPLLERVMRHAGIEREMLETGSAAIAQRFLDETLASGRALHITLDFASLPFTGFADEWAGQMPRQANVVGTAGDEYLLDLSGPVMLGREVLARARAAGRKEKHRSLRFSSGPAKADARSAVRAAVRGTAESYLVAPFKGYASNFGLAGIEKIARLCADPRDKKGWPNLFDSGPLAFLVLLRTWECATLELTPPAGGRAYYASFLEGSADLGLPQLREAAALARASGDLFTELADEAVALGGRSVEQAVEITKQLAEVQRSAGPRAASRVKELRDQRSSLAQSCDLDAPARRSAYAAIGTRFGEILTVERELQRVLATT